jgi:hypothetical protein
MKAKKFIHSFIHSFIEKQFIDPPWSCIWPHPGRILQAEAARGGWRGQLEVGAVTNAARGGPQVAGMRYLHGILGPIVERVFEEKKYVELDPSKVEVKDVG